MSTSAKGGFVIIQRIEIFSLAKVLGVLHAMIGFLIGALMSVVSLLGSGGSEQMAFGSLSIIILPLINLVLGFIGGALVAWCYNLLVSVLGGIKIHLSEE